MSLGDRLGIEAILKDVKHPEIESNIVMFRCRTCCKFIKKDWSKWYCPHCCTSFVEGLNKDEIDDIDELVSYMDEIKEIGGW